MCGGSSRWLIFAPPLAERRRRARTRADRDALFDAYEREILPRATDAVERLAGWIREGRSVALLCFEADPADCHRRRAADAVARAAGVGVLDLRLVEADPPPRRGRPRTAARRPG